MGRPAYRYQDFFEATKVEGINESVEVGRHFLHRDFNAEAPKNEVKKIKTCCRACIANCGVIATVKNGRVVKLEGDPADKMSKGRMCAKGLSGIQALYHPNRNKYPMLRVGKRGEGKWRRISWDKALEIIARKLIDTKKNYGAEAVFCSTGGGGNPEIWSIARFCNIFGTPNWFEPGCAQCYLPRVLAYTMMYGGVDPSIADSNSLELYDTENTPIKTLVLWGTDPSYSCPASGGGAVVDLRAKGVQTVVIDPRLTPDAAKADVWLPVRPGTDVALMMAWIRFILEEKLYDEDFVLRWTNLPYLVDVESKLLLRAERSDDPDVPDTFMVWDEKTGSARPMAYPYDESLQPALRGTYEIDGKTYRPAFEQLWERVEKYTLEKAADICELDAEAIEKAIRLYAENTPSGIAIGVSTDQTPNSEQAAMCTAILDLLMGNVERPGALMQRFKTSGVFDMPNYPVPIAADLLPDEQLKKRLGGIEYKGLHIWYAGHISSVLDAVLTGKPYKPRVWIDRSGNKMAALADSNKVKRVIDELDFIVHMYMYPTSFSAYADILLPTEEWLETDMIVETCNTLCARQAVTHLWETKDETQIWSDLARKCAELGDEDCKRAFDPEFMGKNLPYWDKVTDLWDHFLGRIGLTFDELKEKTPYTYMPKEEWKEYYVYKKTDPKTGKPQGFQTPSRKCELYLESMIELGRTGKPFAKCELPPASVDYDPLPYYMEPYESPRDKEGIAQEYPLVMTGGRVPFFHHNTLRNVAWLREIYPIPELWMYPADAERYGLEDGQWAWVESQRGRIRTVVSVTEGIKPGTVYMERFWNPETLNSPTHGWKEMNVNVLTKADAPFNDVVGTYTLRGFLVKVYPSESAPEGIWKRPQDFKAWLAQPSDPTPLPAPGDDSEKKKSVGGGTAGQKKSRKKRAVSARIPEYLCRNDGMQE
ncbi:MAG: molybdopterin-dependent oxidoreductase [Lachnospiraceae bacterium]|jgi:anaerobic selenocysteine-containing dehydrogenase|nr:molybdopterin-dependent oxidoreductase [Lachnospiraceae bacterium]MCI1657331.1 molybdopterin-dependent oxidoreductase [Lachnospiraceae bacterium]MCI2195809.1 molybdopterin-dependent oxidoreductase [Lachnospiraceae bacterium]